MIKSWLDKTLTPYKSLNNVHHILPNKCACLNKATPRLLILPSHISKTITPISFKFLALMFRYSVVHIVNFIEIRQG